MNRLNWSFLFDEAGSGGSGGGGGQGGQGSGAGGQGNGQGGAAGAAGAGGQGGGSGNGAIVPFHQDWLHQDGTLNVTVYERLPEDVRHLAPTLQRYDTAEKLVRHIGSLETLAGRKGLAPLPANATAEMKTERKALLDSIQGVPKEPKDYGIAKPKDLPDHNWNQELADGFAAICHRWSVPAAAVKEIVELQIKSVMKDVAAAQSNLATFWANEDKLIRASLQAKNVDYDKAAELAARAWRSFGNDPEKDQVFKNSKVFLACYQAGIALGEDNLVKGESEGLGGKSDLDRARDIVNNPANPEHAIYVNPADPNHRRVQEKVKALYASGTKGRR